MRFFLDNSRKLQSSDKEHEEDISKISVFLSWKNGIDMVVRLPIKARVSAEFGRYEFNKKQLESANLGHAWF